MPKSFDFPDAQVKLRIEGDQIRVLLSGGDIVEGVRLGAPVHSQVGRTLVRQHTRLVLADVDLTSDAGKTELRVSTSGEIVLATPSWHATINEVDASTIDVYVADSGDLDRETAARQIASIITAMDWRSRQLNLSTNIEVDLKLALNLEQLRSADEQTVYRVVLPSVLGSHAMATITYNAHLNLIWLQCEDTVAMGFVQGTIERILDGVQNKPALLVYAPFINDAELAEADSMLRDDAMLMYRREDTYILDDGIFATRAAATIPGTTRLKPATLGEVTCSLADAELVATYLNVVDPVGGLYQVDEEVKAADSRIKLREAVLARAGDQGLGIDHVKALESELDALEQSGQSFTALAQLLAGK